MTHLLPPLPYALDSLEPAISAETMALHHDKHHRGYVDKLNTALKPFPQYGQLSVEELLRRLDELDPEIRAQVRKHGGGHANHSLFWQTLAPPGQKPGIDLMRALSSSFGSLDGFREALRQASEDVFGSGWVFLTWHAARRTLQVSGLPNQVSPLSLGSTPVLACDLWEHAYYLQYRHERPRWIDAWWSVINWEAVERNIDSARAEQRP